MTSDLDISPIDRVAVPDPTIAIVGGGPAGLIAAETLAAAGAQVTVYDHRASLGRKFLLAGRGGLNLTHTEDLDQLLERYGPRRPELTAAVAAFGPAELRAWCAGLGEPTFVGTSGRVFPESFRATPLLRAWLRRLDDLGVQVAPRHRWTGWMRDTEGDADPRRLTFDTADGAVVVEADATVLALGGASWPRVSSDGGWVATLRSIDVEVADLTAANVGVEVGWTERFTDAFAGTPLKNVSLSVSGGAAAGVVVRGDVIVTGRGLEGGPVYALTAALRDQMRNGDPAVVFDLQPDLDHDALTDRLTRRRRPKDSLTTWARRSGVAPVALSLLREVTANKVPNKPAELAALLKAAPVPVVALAPIDRAISSAGGVVFDEVDAALMLRRLPGTFVAGEMLDWEAPTGGYLLQACFSTGVGAANGVLARLAN